MTNGDRRAYVLEISIGALDLGEVVVLKGHAPEAVVLGFTSDAQLFPKGVGSLVRRLRRQ